MTVRSSSSKNLCAKGSCRCSVILTVPCECWWGGLPTSALKQALASISDVLACFFMGCSQPLLWFTADGRRVILSWPIPGSDQTYEATMVFASSLDDFLRSTNRRYDVKLFSLGQEEYLEAVERHMDWEATMIGGRYSTAKELRNPERALPHDQKAIAKIGVKYRERSGRQRKTENKWHW